VVPRRPGDLVRRGHRWVRLDGDRADLPASGRVVLGLQLLDNEVIAAGASDDLAYTVAYEHTTASIGGGSPSTYALRVTTVFRREDGEWKVIHRHADSLTSPAAGDVMQQLASGFEISRSASGPSPPSQERR
jgi:SnoaL-like domain